MHRYSVGLMSSLQTAKTSMATVFRVTGEQLSISETKTALIVCGRASWIVLTQTAAVLEWISCMREGRGFRIGSRVFAICLQEPERTINQSF